MASDILYGRWLIFKLWLIWDIQRYTKETRPHLNLIQMTSMESRVGSDRTPEQLKKSFRNKISHLKRIVLFISMNNLKYFTCSC